jgi:hypothetical protein
VCATVDSQCLEYLGYITLNTLRDLATFTNINILKILIGRPVFFLGLGIADSDDDEDDAADMMDDDDAIFLPEKSANNRRIQPLIPDDFGKQTLFLLNCKR